MNVAYRASLEICKRHADRLAWAMSQLAYKFPLSAEAIRILSDTELAVLDQFSARFAKLQDAMGAKLFPAILELTKEQGYYPAFLDKLNRLEKIGAIASADKWLILREMRNEFSHDYPDDPELQAATLNKAYNLASDLLGVLNEVEAFASHYEQVG
jgi:hypothetical protein